MIFGITDNPKYILFVIFLIFIWMGPVIKPITVHVTNETNEPLVLNGWRTSKFYFVRTHFSPAEPIKLEAGETQYTDERALIVPIGMANIKLKVLGNSEDIETISCKTHFFYIDYFTYSGGVKIKRDENGRLYCEG